jgi:Pyruvate kinase
VDHRVEPPAWLPQGAAPEAADPEPDESPAVEDTQAAEDSNTAEAAPEEFANGNGHDSTYSYSSGDSYRYSDDNSFAEGTTYRSPFTPHRPAASDYEPNDSESPDDAEAGNGLPVSSHDGGDLPGSDLPATGLTDPGMPDVGFPHAAAGYSDTTAASYSDPAAIPYPATAPLASVGTTTGSKSGSGDRDSKFGGSDSERGSDTTVTDRGTTLGTAAATAAATVGGIGAALRSGKQRGAARLSRGSTVTKPAKPARSATAKPARSAIGQARRANLVIARLEPWSVMKFSFLMSLVAWVVLFVAVALLYYALSGLGVFAAIQRTLSSVTSSQSSAGVNLAAWTSASRVLGYTMLAGAVDIVLITVLSTIGAMIYNLVTHLGGGIEVTLKETD